MASVVNQLRGNATFTENVNGSVYSFTIYPNDKNGSWTVTPTIFISTGDNFTLSSDDNLTYTSNSKYVSSRATIYVRGTWETVQTRTITVIDNLIGATYNKTEQNNSLTITIAPSADIATGIWKTVPNGTITNDTITNDLIFKENGNEYTATYTFEENDTSSWNVTLTGEYIEKKRTIVINSSLINASYQQNENTNDITITVTPSSSIPYGKWKTTPSGTIINSSSSFDLSFIASGNNYTATYSFNENDVNDWTVTLNGEWENNNITYINNLVNVNYSTSGDRFLIITLIPIDIPNGSWYEQPSGTLKQVDGEITAIQFVKQGSTNTYRCNALTISFYQQYEITLNGKFLFNALTEKYGLLNVYAMNGDLPTTIARKRFVASGVERVDTGVFILGYIRYPFTVETTETRNVMLGWNDTEAQAPIVERTEYSFTVFNKEVSGLYKDARDKNKAVITALLPFVNPITIPSYHINTVIKIVYTIDIIANKCCVTIYSNDVLINVFNTVVGFELPYMTGDFNVIKSLDSNFLSNITPLITVEQSEQVDKSVSNVSGMKALNSITGLHYFDYIIFNDNIPIDAKKEIENIGKSVGIIF